MKTHKQCTDSGNNPDVCQELEDREMSMHTVQYCTAFSPNKVLTPAPIGANLGHARRGQVSCASTYTKGLEQGIRRDRREIRI